MINVCQGMIIKHQPVFMGPPSFWRFCLFKGSDFGLICQQIFQDLPRVCGSDQVGDLSGCVFNMHFLTLLSATIFIRNMIKPSPRGTSFSRIFVQWGGFKDFHVLILQKSNWQSF